MSARERFCLQLEQRLVQSTSQGSQAQQLLPKIEQDMKALDKVYQQSKAQLERADCFEIFLFSKTLKRTRQCWDLNKQVEDTRAKLADLESQRQSIVGTRSNRGAQDELVQALARNGCGANYQQEAAKRERQSGPFGGFNNDDDEGGSGYGMRQQSALPYTTYRTLCVRLCDGYYFPVSYSTLQSQFPKDAQACASKCAAPAELYYHQNPGAEMEQATSVSGQPYSKLPNAFRHRKEVVQGCSCRQADYKPEILGVKGGKRAEGAPAPAPAGTAAAAAAPGATGGTAPKTRVKAAAPTAKGDQDLIAQTIERSRRDEPRE